MQKFLANKRKLLEAPSDAIKDSVRPVAMTSNSFKE